MMDRPRPFAHIEVVANGPFDERDAGIDSVGERFVVREAGRDCARERTPRAMGRVSIDSRVFVCFDIVCRNEYISDSVSRDVPTLDERGIDAGFKQCFPGLDCPLVIREFNPVSTSASSALGVVSAACASRSS